MESRAIIMEILSAVWSCAAELVVLGACHFLRLKSDMPSQLSSAFKMIFPSWRSQVRLMANCCRSTRFFTLFPWMEIGTTFLYFMSRSSLMIILISCSVASKPRSYCSARLK